MIRLFPLCIVLAVSAVSLRAQDATLTKSPLPVAEPNAASSAPPAGTQGTPVSHLQREKTTNPTDPVNSKSLGDELALEFDNLQDVADLLNDKKGTPRGNKIISLYLDGRPMDLQPTVWDYTDKSNRLLFTLKRTPKNEEHWRAIFDSFNLGNHHDVRVWVGVEGEPRKFVLPKNATLRLHSYAGFPWNMLAAVTAIGTAVLLVYLGARSNLLRGLAPRGIPEGLRPPFSLGRTQMAWWFFFIFSAYIFLWLVFGETNSLNATALTLLGISLGTGFVARTIDAGKMSRAGSSKEKLKKLRAQKKLITDKDIALRGKEEQAELRQLEAELTEAESNSPEVESSPGQEVSKGFWEDILSDENGISLHRLQMVAWTLVLTAVFIVDLIKTRMMPTMNNTLLTLMGVSSGAFLGFKLPEKHKVSRPIKNPVGTK